MVEEKKIAKDKEMEERTAASKERGAIAEELSDNRG